MRIACPFCGERELGEFTYLGDAEPQRPAATARRKTRCSTTSICATTSPARCSEYWYHGGGCRAWLKVARNTLTHEITSVEPAAGAGAAKVALMADRAQTHRLASGGLIDRSAPLNFTFDGKPLRRLPGRHAGLGAGRQRRQAGRPLVQVPSPARHADGRLGRAQRAGRVAHAARGASPTPRRPPPNSMKGSKRQPEPLAVAAASI